MPMAVPMTFQRVEVITGRESRRRFSDEEKRELVEETFQPGASPIFSVRTRTGWTTSLSRWSRKTAVLPLGDPTTSRPPLSTRHNLARITRGAQAKRHQ